jgi:peptidoglycan/xylan/chitin deacetylase (PgdA/CDA1 family)
MNSLIKKLVWWKLSLLARLFPHKPRMTVLLYHSISDSQDFFAVSPAMFERQMQHLKKRFDVVPLSRAFAHAAGERVERDSAAITFDDGYRDFLTDALPVLKRHGIPATVFILGDSPDRAELGNDHPLLTPVDFPALADPLVTIGSHGLTHKKLTKMSLEDLKRELEESRRAAEYFAYPKGSYNDTVISGVREAGYEGAVSVVERGVRPGDDAYALPRIQIDSSTTESEFHAKLSLAADWYYALWSLAKRVKAK